MNGIGGWLRRLGNRISVSLRHFMTGRYGMDKLNSVILWTGVIISLLSMFVPIGWANLALALLSYGCLGVALFRCFSRNTYKRYQENRRYLFWREKLRDKEHKYFKCPHCRQSVRVPKGKGRISITCPKCREKFVKKT